MRYHILCFIVGFIFLNCPHVLSSDYVPLDPKKLHLEFKLEDGPFHIEFFKSDKFDGKPKLVINEFGLVIYEKKVCAWPDNKFDPTKSFNMVLIHEETNGSCRVVPALRSTWGDGGAGTAVLTIEVLKVNGDNATMSNGNSQFYFSLKNLKGKFELRQPGTLSNEPGC